MYRNVIVIVATITMAAGFAMAGASPCWYSDSNGFSEHPNCLEHRGTESLRIKPSYLTHLKFDEKLAPVYSKAEGWMYVDKQGNVVVSGVHAVDNGPDAFNHGFVRYERKGKCGYATAEGPGTIIPQFDGCEAFENGKARVCNGCKTVPIEWFCIDTKGERVVCAP